MSCAAWHWRRALLSHTPGSHPTHRPQRDTATGLVKPVPLRPLVCHIPVSHEGGDARRPPSPTGRAGLGGTGSGHTSEAGQAHTGAAGTGDATLVHRIIESEPDECAVMDRRTST